MDNGLTDVRSKIGQLNALLEKSDNIVFFGGAGVSTESGIPDFRSADGLYKDRGHVLPPEKILSFSCFLNQTELFYSYYKTHILHLDAEPNPAHIKLAELEIAGRLRAVITQNIDGLHQKAGSKKVIELHGSVNRNNCLDCGKFYGVNHIAQSAGVPVCGCGGVIKPGVVLYEERLDDRDIENAVEYIKNADVLIIGGTSLVVYPAAGLIRYYTGKKLIIVNKSATDSDDRALLVIRRGIGEVMNALRVSDVRNKTGGL